MNFTETNKELILIHKSMDRIYNINGSVNIMLSPQFYTMKEEELPIKYLYQAKKVASSVLEDFLIKGVEYQYHTYKDGDKWVFIAYNAEEIAIFLESKGIRLENISKLFFAQQYLDKFKTPLVLSEKELLVSIDNNAVIIPSSIMIDKKRNMILNKDIVNRDGVSFGFNKNSLLGYKESIIFASIFFIFGVLFIIEGIHYNNISSNMRAEVDEVLSKYPALQSKYARDNITKKYKQIDEDERHKREILKSLSSLVLNGVVVENLTLNSKKFTTKFKTISESQLIKIKTLASKKGYKTARIGNNFIKIEGNL